MEVYENLFEKFRKYKKCTERFNKLAYEQKELIDNSDFEGIIRNLEKQNKQRNKMEKINEEINAIIESYGNTVRSKFFDMPEVKELQSEAESNIQEALDEIEIQSKRLEDKKSEIGKELGQTKQKVHAAKAYSGEGFYKKNDGTFIDKRN